MRRDMDTAIHLVIGIEVIGAATTVGKQSLAGKHRLHDSANRTVVRLRQPCHCIARDDDVDRRAPSALTLTDQTPIPVTAQIPIPHYVYVGPDRSAGLGTKEAPAIPMQVVGASSILQGSGAGWFVLETPLSSS